VQEEDGTQKSVPYCRFPRDGDVRSMRHLEVARRWEHSPVLNHVIGDYHPQTTTRGRAEANDALIYVGQPVLQHGV
jgi:hypothetical protein